LYDFLRWRPLEISFFNNYRKRTKASKETRRKKINILIKTAISHWEKQGFLKKKETSIFKFWQLFDVFFLKTRRGNLAGLVRWGESLSLYISFFSVLLLVAYFG
jgi:hypothetical protein